MFNSQNGFVSTVTIVIITILITVLTAGGVYLWQSQKTKTQTQKLEEEKQDLQKQVDELKERKKELEKTIEKEAGGGVEIEPGEQKETTSQKGYIVLRSPKSGDTVTSPVKISGRASVFEGTLSLRIKDANGNVIAEDFTTATLGAPEWGDFDTNLNYSVSSSQSGTIEVYTISAKDGSIDDIVSISVTLK
jgi:type II secretory pathway pseudopilin PulG